MALDLSKPPFGGKPIDQEIRDNFNALKAILDADAPVMTSLAAKVSSIDADLSSLTSRLSESYYTSSETDTLLGDKVDSSIIDTVGDLLSKNAGGLTAIAAGAAGTVLTGQGAGVLPAWVDPGAYKQVDRGTFSRDATEASGTDEIACDFEPDFIFFVSHLDAYGGTEAASFGFYDGSTNICLNMSQILFNTSYIALFYQDTIETDDYQAAAVSAKDSDSFTLSWTKVGNGANLDIEGVWVAIGS